jgi:hypothetical protein
MRDEPNFKEVETCEEANAVDMKIWKFMTYEGGKYVFARRVKPLTE